MYLDVQSISIRDRLIGSLNIDGNVVSLILREDCKLSAKSGEMKSGDLLIELLGEYINLTLLVLLGVFVDPEVYLSDDLISE